MARFFNYFSKTPYTLNDAAPGVVNVTNIMNRFGFEQSLKENSSAFYKHLIHDGETPELLAFKYYDNPERHWIILLFNEIIDPQNDWPLQTDVLYEFIDKKYATQGGLSWARNINNVHSYYKISTRISDYDGTKLVEKLQITPQEYANTGTSVQSYTLQDGMTVTEEITTQALTYYDYEVEVNESKRVIKILKSEFVPTVEKEFKKVVK